MPKNLRVAILTLILVVISLSSVRAIRAQSGRPSKKAAYVTSTSDQTVAAENGVISASPTAAKPAPVVTGQPGSGYHVGPEDELTISVWHEPELSQAVMVRSDGMITLPLLNDIKVSGLTTQQVQSLLTEKMKPLVNDPQVTVIVRAIRSQKVFLVGNIARPGAYPLTGGETALELVAEAGGPGAFAKRGSTYVLRKKDGKEIRLPFNYKKALDGNGPNPELMSGDIVVIP